MLRKLLNAVALRGTPALGGPARAHKFSRRAVAEACEPRVLYSADLNPLMWAAGAASAEVRLQGASASSSSLEVAATQQTRVELVFVDAAVADAQRLVDALLAARRSDSDTPPQIEVIQLDADRDGLTQITEVLAHERDISAIHIISHGDVGSLRLGSAVVDAQALTQNSAALQQWRSSLTADADILLYGCDVAQGAVGDSFIHALAQLTDADVAASTDPTGNASLGGNWLLEDRTGHIEATVATDDAGLQSWNGLLDVTTGLRARWTFDSNANDSSGNAYNGTLTNGALIDTAPVTVQVGPGKLFLDGNNDYVDLSAHRTNFTSLTQGSISAWIKTTDSQGAIFALSDIADANSYAVLGVNGGKLNFFVAENNVAILNVSTTASVTDDAWHHVAVTVGAGGNKLYIDGVLQTVTYGAGTAASTSFFSTVTGVDTMTVGTVQTSSGFSSFLAGLVDDVRVYDRVLSNADMSQLAVEHTLYTQQLTGGGVAFDVKGMRNNTGFSGGTLTPTLTIAGVPAGATIVKAWLYVSELSTGAIDTSFTLAGNSVTATAVSSSTDPGWGASAVVTVKADVSAIVTGNGDYVLGGANGLGADQYEGAVLVVVYSDASSSLQKIVTVSDQSNTIRDTDNSFLTVFNNGNNFPLAPTAASLYLATFDSQSNFSEAALQLRASTATTATTIVAANSFNGPNGGGNKNVVNISALISKGASSATLTQVTTNADDYLVYPFWASVVTLAAPPTNTVPGAQSTAEDTTEVFSNANGNAIFITDADAGGASNQVIIRVSNGTLTLSGTAGLTFAAGDGTADASMQVVGTASAINAALNGSIYTPTPNYFGAAQIEIVTQDSTLVALNSDNNLLGSYAFDDIGNVGTDWSPQGAYPGTGVGVTVVSDPTRFDVLSLAGAGYIQFTGHYANPGNVTLGAWVNLTSADSAGAEVISLGDSVVLRLDSGGFLTGSIFDGTSYVATQSAATLAGTGWHFVAYSFDDAADSAKLYLDGNLVATTSTTASISYTLGANSFIGKHGNGDTNFDFNGRIDDARVYNRVLTANEIATIASDSAMVVGSSVPITVTAVNDAPIITSNGSGATAAIAVLETTSTVTTVTSTDVDGGTAVYSISGGADAARFSINASTGVLTFVAPPDFEVPSDADMNNVYDVTVQVYDGSLTDTQAIAVTVVDVSNVLVVTTTADTNDSGLGSSFTIEQLNASKGTDGAVSLREAIIAANNTAGADTISFNITGAGVRTITVGASELPTITSTVLLDGWSQPGFAGSPLIELNGGGNSNRNGLTFAAGSAGSTLRGFIINRFQYSGIEINSTSNITVQGNWIGLNATGNAAAANGDNGIYAYNSTGLLIGGTTVNTRNVISGNTSRGIYFINTDASTLSGNYVGTDVSGTLDVNGNALSLNQSGIVLSNGSYGNVVGGLTAGARNILSGNNHFGIEIQSGSQSNALQGNFIGTALSGASALGNVSGGVSLWGAGTGNVVGGNVVGARNVISANASRGVQIGNGTVGGTVQGNYIGTNANGTATLGGQEVGVEISGAAVNALIGTDADGNNDATERNVISGNSREGVLISNSGGSGTRVQGNYIGTDATGMVGVGNGLSGVGIYGGSDSRIGGTAAGAGNVLSSNGDNGVTIASTDTFNNFVQGNVIGLNATQTAALGNTYQGVWIGSGSFGNTVGGTSAAAGNVIGGNTYAGVELYGAGTDNNTVAGNTIGSNAAGTLAFGNGAGVVVRSGGQNNRLGGEAAGAGNLITNNGGPGVAIVGPGSFGNAVLGNRISSNGFLGIDLNDDGVTANDTGDADSGSNGLQNTPVLNTARAVGTSTLWVTGSINSAANSQYRIELFANTSQDASIHGQGQRYMGFANVTTDAAGNASFTANLSGVVAVGEFISATATQSNAGFTTFGSSSEFAKNVAVVDSTQAVITVDTTSDALDGDTSSLSALLADRGADGKISLREAITAANNTANGSGAADRIQFNIVDALVGGEHTISVATELPAITDALQIDGTTEPDFLAAPVVRIDGASTYNISGLILDVGSSGSSIRGISVTGFLGNGMPSGHGLLVYSNNNVIAGNYLGLRNDGVAAGNWIAIALYGGATGNLIGGTTATERNVVSGNTSGGVAAGAVGTNGNVIAGNYFGVAADGITARPNGNFGVNIWGGASQNLVGGTISGSGNLIRNSGQGIRVDGAAVNNALLGNSIYANPALGIDLNADGVTLNDAGDADTGANNAQNFPVLSSARTNGTSQLFISASLNSTALTSFRIEFFASIADDASGYGQGQRFLGFANVTTDNAGNYTGNVTLSATVPLGEFVSATATRANGAFTVFTDTSEFARNVLASVASAVGTSSGNLAYTENASATAIDSGLTVTDADPTPLSSATVSISANFAPGQDVLAFTNQNGITGFWNAGTGVLTLNGTSSVANYQSALRSVTYFNNSDNPSTLTRTVAFKVNDGQSDSNTATRNLDVTAVNDAPVLAGSGGTLAYTENDAATVVSSTLTVSDVDNVNLSGATVSISTGFVSGEDVLAFTDQSGITGSWNAGNGVLTLSGSSSVANYQAALRSVTYANASDNPNTATRTVSFTTSDGAANSNIGTRNISVAAVNDVPVNTLPSGLTVNEDGTLALSGISIADADAGSSLLRTTLTVAQGTLAAVGTGAVTVTGSGTASITLVGTLADLNAYFAGASKPSFAGAANANGTVQLSMVTSDGLNAGTGGTVATGSLDYRFQDGTPTGFDPDNISSVGGLTGVANNLNVSALATALSGSSTSFGVIYTGIVEVTTAGNYTFTVAADDAANLYIDGTRIVAAFFSAGTSNTVNLGVGQHSLELRFVQDTGGASLSASYSGPDTGAVTTPLFSAPAVGRLVSQTATTNITVTAVNDAPIIVSNGGANTASVAMAENLTTVATVTSTDVDGDPLTYSISAGADAARFTINSQTGVLSFITPPDFEAPTDADLDNIYNVTVRVSDGFLTDVQAFDITVTDVSSTLIVTTTADTNDTGLGTSFTAEQLNANKGADGAVSLREAIIAANNTVGRDVVSFNIAGTGVHTINVSTALPTITDAIIINGWSQANFSGTPVIELSGGDLPGSGVGLMLANGSSTSSVRGLIINRFAGNGIEINDSGTHTLQGNWIGLSATGNSASANGDNGIYINNSSFNLIGGVTASERNVVSGNVKHGIVLRNVFGNQVTGNYIGTDSTGSIDVNGNVPSGTQSGVRLTGNSYSNLIGGTTAGARNVISGNNTWGIEFSDNAANNIAWGNYIGTTADGLSALGNTAGGAAFWGSGLNNRLGGSAAGAGNLISGNHYGVVVASGANGSVIQGNLIGVAVDGNTGLGNSATGVLVAGGAVNTLIGSNADGSADAAEGNVIAFNGGSGVVVRDTTTTGATVLQNRIFSNALMGIDLGDDGITANDVGDIDSGANDLQNTPTLTGVNSTGGNTTLAGTLNSNASGNYRIEFFSAPVGSPAQSATTYLGFVDVSTNGAGNTSFNALLSGITVAAGDRIVATATAKASGAYTDTSEFSSAVVATANSAPVITSNGGGATAAVNVAENTSAVTTVAATDADLPAQTLTYSIVGGADASKFTVNASTGALSFITAPDFEAPTDVGANNVYDVTVQVFDGMFTDSQALAVTVTNVNEAPGGSNTTVNTAENTAFVFSIADFGFIDADAGDSLSAVRIDSTPLAGSLTLNGLAVAVNDVVSAAQLAAGNLVFTPAASGNGLSYASFDFSVRDQGNVFDVTPNAITLNVGAVNDAPVVTTTPGTLVYTENDASTAIDAALTLSDIDSANLSAASVTISANYQNGEDVLAVVNAYGITGAWNASTGVLSLSGSATVAQYQAVLRSVTYVNTSDNPSAALRTVTFNVTDDGALASNNASRNLSVTPVNDAPVLVAASPYLNGITEDELNNGGQTVASFIGSSITDAETANPGIAVNAVTNGNGTWQYSINNGATWTSLGAVSNSAALLLRSTDLLRLVPNGNHATTATLAYRAWDTSGGAAGAKVNATAYGASTAFSSNTDTATILVSDVNDAPIVTSHGGAATVNVAVAETLTAVSTVTAMDVDTAVLTYSIVGGADQARFLVNASTGALSFITAPDFEAPADSDGNSVYDVTVQVSDGAGGTATQAFTITVLDVSSALVVTTTSDTNDTGLGTSFTAEQLNASKGADGAVSLREALIAANNTPGLDTISFNIGAGSAVNGVYTINVLSALPEITDATLIDGWSQPSFVNRPVIELNGAGFTTGTGGLNFRAGSGGSTLQGLIVNRFTGTGVDARDANDFTIRGNWIGLDATGTAAAGNSGVGLYLSNTHFDTIGGGGAQNRNVISGNASDGIFTIGMTDSTISGNYVGTSADGMNDVSGTGLNYSQAGITLSWNSSYNTIGGTTAATRNVLSGNNNSGLAIGDFNSTNNSVMGNYIGVAADGVTALGNSNAGVVFWGAGLGNVLGGSTPDKANVIAGNLSQGVYVGNSSNSVAIQGNLIGVLGDGSTVLGNAGAGVVVSYGARNTVVGTDSNGVNDAAEGNVISGNAAAGVVIEGASVSGTVVSGNRIGTDASGTLARGNGGAGVLVDQYTHDNTIGGSAAGAGAGAGNLIAYNGGDGIRLSATSASGNAILGNRIWGNAQQSIDLNGDGVTANDAGDADSGPNMLQNTPVLISANSQGGNTTVVGSLNSNASADYRIEFFSSPTGDLNGHGAAAVFLGFAVVSTDASGNANFSALLGGVSVSAGHIVSATATRVVGGVHTDTSELSLNVTATANGAPAITTPGAQSTNEDTALTISGLSVTDAEGNLGTVQLSVAQGALTVSLGAGASISAGANASNTLTLSGSQAQINSALASLSYVGALNFNGADTLSVLATDTLGYSSSSAVSIGVSAVNDAPVINSNGGGAAASVSVAETLRNVTTITSSDVDGGLPTYSILGGVDAALFSINASTGALSFITAPDFEAPTDSDANNIYAVTVQVSDGAGGTATQTFTITVLDVSSALVVTTTSDTNDSGLGSSFTAEQLNASKGTDGAVSLREALIAANNTAGLDTISFNITDPLVGGAHTIELLSALPNITDAVVLDASTEPDFAATGSRPVVVVNGLAAGNGVVGLAFEAGSGGSTVRGLVIDGFHGSAIRVAGGSANNTFVGNYLGTDVSGSLARPNGRDNASPAIILLSDGNQVGGTTAADRNVVSGNNSTGVWLNGSNNRVQGNFIGTDATGNAALGNVWANVGIATTVSGNLIGGTTAGSANTIANSSLNGVLVYSSTSTGNAILGNRIFNNVGLGIDLGLDGVTANDAGDADSGANDLQNFPVLMDANSLGGNTTVRGNLNSAADRDYRIEFFASPAGDASGYGEAAAFMGFVNVRTDGTGNVNFAALLSGVAVPVGQVVSATATQIIGAGVYASTSEFAAHVTVTANSAPRITVPGPQVASDDTTLALGGVGVADAEGNLSTVQLSVAQGVLSVNLNGGASISAGSNASNSFTLSGSQAQINTALASLSYLATLNFSGADTLTVLATDTLGYSSNSTVLINVSAVNDAPVITSNGGGATAAISVAENVTAVTTVAATDVDLPTQTLTYSIVGGADAAKFAINASTGVLTFVTAPDFEAPTDSGANNIYDVTVQVTDGMLIDAQAIAVYVTPVNDNAPVITSNGGGAAAAINVAENSTAVATVTATDADLPAQALTFAIVGGADAAKFAVNATTGALSFVNAPDHERPTDTDADNIYELTVQVSDYAGATSGVSPQALQTLQMLRVTVQNVNEAPVLSAPAVVALSEAAASGTLVASATAADPDANDALRFALVNDANGRFVINAANGQISVAVGASFDSKTAAGHDLLVRVFDQAGLSAEQAVRVNLQAVVPVEPTAPASLPEASPVSTPAFVPVTPEATPQPPTSPSPTPKTAETIVKPGNASDTQEVAAQRSVEGSSADTLQGKRTALDGGDRGYETSVWPTQLRRREEHIDTQYRVQPVGAAASLTWANFDLAAPPAYAVANAFEFSNILPTAKDDSAANSSGLGHGLRHGIAVALDPETAQQAANHSAGGASKPLSFDQVFTSSHVASVSFSAGFIWWLTRGGGLLTSMLMGVPAWRHLDLLPVLARNLDDEDDTDDGLAAPLPRKPALAAEGSLAKGHGDGRSDGSNQGDGDGDGGGDGANRAHADTAVADNQVEGLFDRGLEPHANRTNPTNFR